MNYIKTIFKGPPNPDVFQPFVEEERKNISEEVLKESKIIQGEIMLLLNKVSMHKTTKIIGKFCCHSQICSLN